MSYAIVIASMPSIILFNITVPLYVIPTSYFIAKKVAKGLKIEINSGIRVDSAYLSLNVQNTNKNLLILYN